MALTFMIRKIKVCHIITRMDRGGAPDIVRILFERLDPALFELTLIYGLTVLPSEKTREFIKKLGAKAVFLPELRRDIHPFFDALVFFKLLKFLKREKFDVVHVHTAKAGILGRIAAKWAGVRGVVYSTHGHDFYGYFGGVGSFLVVLAEKFASFFCDKIHVLTELEKKDFLKFRICPEDKIEVIYSGVELEALRRGALSLPCDASGAGRGHKDVYRIGMVGRLESVKGPGYFIEAAQIISAALPEMEFLVVGDGSMRGALEKLVLERGLKNKVIFTGWLEDAAGLMKTLDLLVLPSLNEAVGRSLLEAQAVGVPVVATRVGGVPEVIQDGKTGVLVEPKNPQQLAEAVVALLKDEKRRREMAEAAKAWVDERFSALVMVEKFESLYQMLSSRSEK